MSGSTFPMWLFFVVPMLIAVVAFGIAQLSTGAGMIFTIGACAVWMAANIVRARRNLKHG
ncbi:hypothetical protein [Sphingomonas sp.]|uniref:hypothetical protein n=1 Tax=Sphingomonas sp. TaxID=28214 RepID=UPI003B3BA700